VQPAARRARTRHGVEVEAGGYPRENTEIQLIESDGRCLRLGVG
jgi:hypothetical protein